MKAIAHIQSDFQSKFGIPRQSGLIKTLVSRIVFEPEWRNPDALRGIEGFSHLWLLWEFSENLQKKASATVRPPRLGGNQRIGVFASRSPFRPNPIGLSCVQLKAVEYTNTDGPVLFVLGADLLDGTPIYDIKPYVPYTDCHPEAVGGFAAAGQDYCLKVEIPQGLLDKVPEGKRQALEEMLAQDPRPAYQSDPHRLYGLCFAGFEIRFAVENGLVTVTSIEPTSNQT